MRNTEEQLKEILKRSEKLKYIKDLKRKMAGELIAITAMVLMVISAGIYSPRVMDMTTGQSEVKYGSLILSASHMSLVVIGVLAFVLGITVTLFCLHLREYTKNKE